MPPSVPQQPIIPIGSFSSCPTARMVLDQLIGTCTVCRVITVPTSMRVATSFVLALQRQRMITTRSTANGIERIGAAWVLWKEKGRQTLHNNSIKTAGNCRRTWCSHVSLNLHRAKFQELIARNVLALIVVRLRCCCSCSCSCSCSCYCSCRPWDRCHHHHHHPRIVWTILKSCSFWTLSRNPSSPLQPEALACATFSPSTGKTWCPLIISYNLTISFHHRKLHIQNSHDSDELSLEGKGEGQHLPRCCGIAQPAGLHWWPSCFTASYDVFYIWI